MPDALCSIPDCTRPARARGWCPAHYTRWRKHGDPLGSAPPRVRTVKDNGYVRVKVPGHPEADAYGWALEHRVVAHDTFGPIPEGWHVHHRNHDRADNRPENLEVLHPSKHLTEHHRTYDWHEVAELYRSGLTTVQVGERLGIDPGQVSRVLKKLGVRTRPQPRVQVDDERLRHLHATTALRSTAIARELGVGVAVVRRRMKELGLAPRPVGRPPADVAA